MAATVEIHSFHGSTPGNDGVDVTGTEIRHKRADNDTVDVNNPIPVPAAGTNYGWRKLTRMKVISGIGTQIGNIRWYAASAPANWAGTVSLFSGTTPSYLVVGNSADETAQLANTADANLYTSASPLTVNAAANAIVSNGSYGTQDYVLQQVGVLSGTPSGVKTARQIVYRYDEI